MKIQLIPYIFIELLFFLVIFLVYYFFSNKKYMSVFVENTDIKNILTKNKAIIFDLEKKIVESENNLKLSQLDLIYVKKILFLKEEKLNVLKVLNKEYISLSHNYNKLLETSKIQEIKIFETSIRLREVQKIALEKQNLMLESENRLKVQFENLANRIFDVKNENFKQQHYESIVGLTAPLREKLDTFMLQVKEVFNQDSKNKTYLLYEIQNLKDLHVKMKNEARNLTNALKGNNKLQGNWGELILTRILEASGLRKGHEYNTHVNIVDQEYEDNKIKKPDVVVYLPHGRHVIIDAKMNLIAYERYFNSDDKEFSKQAMRNHISAIKNHIRLLSNKSYQDSLNFSSLDYIIMFIPIEPAFLLAISEQPDLLYYAVKKNIMLVSPSSLLVALRTINNLWRYEHQNINSKKIVQKASRIYDKTRLFFDDLLIIQNTIEKLQQNCENAIKKFSKGKGNLLMQIESFRHLGIDIKRSINANFLENISDDVISNIE